VEPESVTLILGAEEVKLPRDDVKQIMARVVERSFLPQELREVLADALTTGSSRVNDAHRIELLSVLEAMHSRELRHLWDVAQNPILPAGGL
jgi:hypothetical protein